MKDESVENHRSSFDTFFKIKCDLIKNIINYCIYINKLAQTVQE